MTPEELNRINAEYCAKRQEKFAEQCKKHPERLDVAARRATKLVQAGLVGDADFLADTSIEAAMAKSSSQSELASRTRKRSEQPTIKSEFIKQMARARREGMRLSEFIESVKSGSVEGVELYDHKSGRYVVDAEAVVDGTRKKSLEVDEDDLKKASLETLKGWWKEAGKIT